MKDCAINFDVIANEIDKGRPVACFISWNNTPNIPGHFVAVSGYRRTDLGNMLTVYDPVLGRGSVHRMFQSQLKAYEAGQGEWTHTYLISFDKLGAGGYTAEV